MSFFEVLFWGVKRMEDRYLVSFVDRRGLWDSYIEIFKFKIEFRSG